MRVFTEASKVAQEFLNVDMSKYPRKYTLCMVLPSMYVVFWYGGVRLSSGPGLAPQLPPPWTRTMGLTNLISKSSPMPQLHS